MLEVGKKVLGAEHPSTLTATIFLAVVFWAQERRSEAIKLVEEVVELRKKVLGANHPQTISAINVLAEWKDVLEFDAALPYMGT